MGNPSMPVIPYCCLVVAYASTGYQLPFVFVPGTLPR